MAHELMPPGRSLDIGCGGGHLSRFLADQGWEVAGFDISPAMIRMAQDRVPTGKFWVDDLRTAPLGNPTLVTATGEVLAYALDKMALASFAGRLRATMRPGGLFLFDLPTFDQSRPTHAIRKGKGWEVEAWTQTTANERIRTIETRRGELVTRESHRQHLHDADEVLATLAAAGFAAQWLGGYDDHGFEPGWDGFLAKS